MCPKDIEFAEMPATSLAEIFAPPKEHKPDRFYTEPLVFAACPKDEPVGQPK